MYYYGRYANILSVDAITAMVIYGIIRILPVLSRLSIRSWACFPWDSGKVVGGVSFSFPDVIHSKSCVDRVNLCWCEVR